jgi:hypothetical protein
MPLDAFDGPQRPPLARPDSTRGAGVESLGRKRAQLAWLRPCPRTSASGMLAPATRLARSCEPANPARPIATSARLPASRIRASFRSCARGRSSSCRCRRSRDRRSPLTGVRLALRAETGRGRPRAWRPAASDPARPPDAPLRRLSSVREQETSPGSRFGAGCSNRPRSSPVVS